MSTNNPPQRSSLLSRLSRSMYRTKRAILNRRGDGVHSPYAFAIIRQVFRNPYPYNAFASLGANVRSQGKQIKALYGDRLIRRRSIAEVIFRLIHREALENIVLISPQESLLVDYLKATGKVKSLTHTTDIAEASEISQSDLIIIEDLPQGQTIYLEQWIDSLNRQKFPLYILWHRSHPRLGKEIKAWRKRARPIASFCSLDLELWVWRQQLTPGHYKIYSH